MKVYDLKRPPFEGTKAGLSSDKYIAIPSRNYEGKGKFVVKYKDEEMIVNDWRSEAVSFLKQKDKFGRGYFTLGYFKWKGRNE